MKSNIGEYIKAERLRYKDGNNVGISQIDLSLKIGWENPSTLSRIEQGKIIPTKDTAIKIFEALGIPSVVIACILIKSNHFNTTGLVSTKGYVEKIINTLIPKIEILKYPVLLMIYPNDNILYMNNIARKVFLGNEINSKLENIFLSEESYVSIILNPEYGVKEVILNWEEFVKIIISNQHIIYNDTDREREYIKSLKKFPKFNEFWKESENKTVDNFKSFNIPFIYNSPILGEIKFLVQEYSLLEDNRFFILQFTPSTQEDIYKLESII